MKTIEGVLEKGSFLPARAASGLALVTMVSSVRKGEKVLISCITSCGKCDVCKKRMYSHCRSGGWILGDTIDGTQAEYVRTPSEIVMIDLDENRLQVAHSFGSTAPEAGDASLRPGRGDEGLRHVRQCREGTCIEGDPPERLAERVDRNAHLRARAHQMN